MFDFTYCTPTKVVFGKNSEGRLGELAKEFGAKKVLIHYGGGKALGGELLSRLRWSLTSNCAELSSGSSGVS